MAALRADYALEAAPEQDGLQWVQATPKARDGQLKSVRVGFEGDKLAALDILDKALASVAQIRFTGMQLNPALPAGSFQFKPPAGGSAQAVAAAAPGGCCSGAGAAITKASEKQKLLIEAMGDEGRHRRLHHPSRQIDLVAAQAGEVRQHGLVHQASAPASSRPRVWAPTPPAPP